MVSSGVPPNCFDGYQRRPEGLDALRCPLWVVVSSGRRNTLSHYSLLGFESQGLAHAASNPKVSGFSAAVKPRKYPRRIVIHSIFPPFRIECCADRLS